MTPDFRADDYPLVPPACRCADDCEAGACGCWCHEDGRGPYGEDRLLGNDDGSRREGWSA